MRLAIAGVPKGGKTTRAAKETGPVYHTDDLIGDREWSEASAEAMTWFDRPGPWVIEGVAVPRALRKWLAAHAGGKPADLVLWMGTPRQDLTKGQAAMAKGCQTVMREIIPLLERCGVKVEQF